MSLELLRITCNEISTLDDLSQLSHAGQFWSLFQAARHGIPEFIIELLNAKPDLLYLQNKQGRNFLLLAIQYRQAKVLNLIYGVTSSIRDNLAVVKDKSGNTALHMAALLAPSEQLNQIPGAAVQMQRELQWFKEVEHVMIPSMCDEVNNNNKTARQLFTEQHMDLRKDGEKWMKQNATSYTIVAALIVTIMFAVSFTVPGGNDQNTGYPVFQDHKLFKLFIISDATSLFSSTTSLLMFLGILTSRYAEDDFLKSLPNKLIIGLSMMFISIATMMITFSTAISIMFPGKLWINILMIVFACVPISSFIWLQFPLLIEVVISTYRPGIFERNMKRWF
ncbi:hypothetical protein L6164_008750 [Bauhinia variegata]|uniref:Uncharacterized protein n=1 Tax=Bauhinia variegata TaxID=167791 RepID=A0ACB9PGJ8_BAUVA|nr:hypothetical protein L6164_008750 [Bauhinia variegata]